LANDLGVSKWEIGVDTIVYVDDLDHIDWHSDSDQGATTVATIILDAGQSVQPVLVREKGMKSAYPKARLELKLKTGTLYVMNKQTQQHYDHMVSKTTLGKGHPEKKCWIVVVFRDGQRKSSIMIVVRMIQYPPRYINNPRSDSV